jgi:AraC-like DNA-binding protein
VTITYTERLPPPVLRPYVECLWRIHDRTARAGRVPVRVVPDGCPELIVHLGDPFARRVADRWVVQPRVFLAGTLRRPWLLRAGRRMDTVSVRFRPGMATALLPIRMAEAADREVPLAHIAGRREAASLLSRVATARGAASRFAVLARWLEGRLDGAPERAADARAAVDRIREDQGRSRVEDVARALGWSRRRLERVFARDLGIPPKVYARIVRLNAVLLTLDEPTRARAVDLALDMGYFDQSHLLRDFRALAGRRPGAGRDGDGEMARHFTDPDRLRALLAGA